MAGRGWAIATGVVFMDLQGAMSGSLYGYNRTDDADPRKDGGTVPSFPSLISWAWGVAVGIVPGSPFAPGVALFLLTHSVGGWSPASIGWVQVPFLGLDNF